METKVTLLDALKLTVKGLEGISVPMGMIDSIGIPIAKSINSLKDCINAIEQAQKAEETPELELVEAGDSDDA